MSATAVSVLTGILINLVTAIICFLVFAILRNWEKAVKFYDPKRYTPEIERKPAALPTSFFGWIQPVFAYKEADIIRECGLDTAIYLRLLKYGRMLFLWVSVYAIVVVLPVNVSDNQVNTLMDEPDSNFSFSNFDKLSLSNVQPRSMRMWVHLVGVYVITFAALKLIWTFSADTVLLRIQFLGNSRPGGPTHSVLVTDVPAVMEATEAGVKERKELKKQATGKARSSSSSGGGGGDSLSGGKKMVTGGRPSAEGTDALKQTSDSDINLQLEKMDAAKEVAIVAPTEGRGQSVMPLLRRRKVFTYDPKDESLNPDAIAVAKLREGATPTDLVRDEFELVYRDDLDSVQVVHDISGLTKLVDEYNQRKQQIEDYLDAVNDLKTHDKPLPEAKVTLLFPDAWMKERYGGRVFTSADGFSFWRDRMTYLENEILEQQAAANLLAWPSAFVTFKTRVSQSVSATGLQQHDERTWRTRGAPAAGELIWSNLGMTSTTRESKSTIVWVLFWLMCFFYMIPIAAIQGLIDVPRLAKIPGLKEFLNAPVVKQVIQAILPGLVLKIFLAMLPWILATMMRVSGAVCESEVDFGVVTRFYIFQVIVVFFGNVIFSSFFSQVEQWIDNPTSVVSILGTAVPQAVTFFINYTWVNIGGYAISFLRIVGLVLFRLFTWLTASPRARDRIFQEQYTSYGTSVTPHTMTILLGLVFCLINPIIAPTALVYFAITSVVDKYNNIYVYRRNYESSGLLWVRVLNQVMTALYIFQLVMIGLLSVKKFAYSPIIIPCILATIGFHLNVLKLFARPWTIMSLHDAAQLDVNDKLTDADTIEAPPQLLVDPEEYVYAGFKISKGDANALLLELAEVEPLVRADLDRRAKEKAAQKAEKKGCCA